MKSNISCLRPIGWKDFEKRFTLFQPEALTEQLNAAREAYEHACAWLDPESTRQKLAELEDAMASPGFWDDAAAAQRVSAESAALQAKLSHVTALEKMLQDAREWMDMAVDLDDESAGEEAAEAVRKTAAAADSLYLQTLLRGEYDANNAYVSVHAGAGGTEAQDWAQMVLRMIQRYCERQGWRVTLLDAQDGDEAGIKSAELFVEGENAYGFLRSEKGVHRLVRISPYDANARRHTSFCSMDVMPEVQNDSAVQINPEDLRVDTYRASGAGGQHINKTESAIRITHIPSGVVVSCQTQRSQIQNRETAMAMLRARLVELQEREHEAKMAEVSGELKKIEWGSQIRSYVLHPYSMVNDHRTGFKTADAQGVLDGELYPFVNAYLRMV